MINLLTFVLKRYIINGGGVGERRELFRNKFGTLRIRSIRVKILSALNTLVTFYDGSVFVVKSNIPGKIYFI